MRNPVAVLFAGVLSFAMAAEGRETGYMKLFTAEEAAGPHVQARSRELPKTRVDGQWEGIVAAGDGKTYFAASCHSKTDNGQFFCYDPKTDKVSHIIDVGAWCGQPADTLGKQNTQGKIHSQIFEADGKLYCSTTSAHMPKDFPYQGGHFLSYDLKTGECEDLGRYRDSQGGLLTMYYEPIYRRLYAISQGDQTLIYYDLKTGKIVKVGSIENNPHQCRVLISDQTGNVYGSTWDGVIYRYDPKLDRMSCLLTRIPHDPDAPQPPRGPLNFREMTRWDSRMSGWHCTHWVMIVWDPKTQWWYGVRGNDEYLFRFRPPTDPKSHRGRIEGLAPIGYLPSTERQPRFASLALTLKGDRIYYVSYTPWRTMSHLMSYDIPSGKVTNHGPIVTDGDRRVAEIHSMVVGSDGKLHAVAGVWSIKGKDPANPWSGRAYCYYHARFLMIDTEKDLKNQKAAAATGSR